jgi:hypothetical protein
MVFSRGNQLTTVAVRLPSLLLRNIGKYLKSLHNCHSLETCAKKRILQAHSAGGGGVAASSPILNSRSCNTICLDHLSLGSRFGPIAEGQGRLTHGETSGLVPNRFCRTPQAWRHPCRSTLQAPTEITASFLRPCCLSRRTADRSGHFRRNPSSQRSAGS